MMKIRSRGLNRGETFCCSKNDVKKVFGDAEITISFGQYGGRDFDVGHKYYKGPKLKGKIIASLGILNIDTRIGMDNAMISFFVIKNEQFSDELRKEFISMILPIMYKEYLLYQDGNPENISGVYYFFVELHDGALILHKGIQT